VEGTSRGLF